MVSFFADVLLPIPLAQAFTYAVPSEWGDFLKVGMRVIVNFGKNKVSTGIVASIHQNPPKNAFSFKYILEILDEKPSVLSSQLRFFEWLADYYMCTIGEVINVALPSGLKISSQSMLQYNPEFDYPELLTDFEKDILEKISSKPSLSYQDLRNWVDEKQFFPLLKSLVAKHAIVLFEEVKEKYTPKIRRKIRFTPQYQDKTKIHELVVALEEKKKKGQVEAILFYIQQSQFFQFPQKNEEGIEKKQFSEASISESALDTLIKNGIFESYKKVVPRFDVSNASFSIDELPELSEAQGVALESILDQLAEKNTILLQGITGSGKTEIYIHLIHQAIESGSQVLFLVPEIALTTQIVLRLKKIFGEAVGVYHSRFSDNERVEVWNKVLSGDYSFVVGVRSSLFLPFSNLGLIVIDEEHEPSYKQYDPAPRYHARDAALMLAHFQQAKVVLGSATPSIESLYYAHENKYGHVCLNERFSEAKLPEYELINLKIAKQKKELTEDFSNVVLEEIKRKIERKEQTIIFQNRRGYAPYWQCQTCDWISTCHQCDVSLTVHYAQKELRCHYCGYRETLMHICPSCKGRTLINRGFGTEKLEDDLRKIFPNETIVRLDLDSTRQKNALIETISRIEKGDVSIIVGTQMIAKGFDFKDVTLVCIFDVDRMIHFPDFRSKERVYQLVTQVAGRAGRGSKPGTVMIQTYNPSQKILQQIFHQKYHELYEEEITERKFVGYPPFARLIKISLRHEDSAIACKAAEKLGIKIRERLSERVLGPQAPLVERVRNTFIFDILVKLEKTIDLKSIKHYLVESIHQLLTEKDFKKVRYVLDVDPV